MLELDGSQGNMTMIGREFVMEQRMKHLEMIQAIITRMSNSSFLIKGWAITLISALMALSAKDANVNFLVISFLVIIMFWVLDTFFLRQERLFRKLYDKVRILNPDDIDFSMRTKEFENETDVCRCNVFFSETLLVFYGTLIIVLLAISYLLGLITF